MSYFFIVASSKAIKLQSIPEQAIDYHSMFGPLSNLHLNHHPYVKTLRVKMPAHSAIYVCQLLEIKIKARSSGTQRTLKMDHVLSAVLN
jgi:hypothetical protein